jgi:hypothetical protein
MNANRSSRTRIHHARSDVRFRALRYGFLGVSGLRDQFNLRTGGRRSRTVSQLLSDRGPRKRQSVHSNAAEECPLNSPEYAPTPFDECCPDWCSRAETCDRFGFANGIGMTGLRNSYASRCTPFTSTWCAIALIRQMIGS